MVLPMPLYFLLSSLLILMLSRQPRPPSQCAVGFLVVKLPQPMHGFSAAKGCSLAQCPQIMRVANFISWAPSCSSWHLSHGYALPQHGNLSHLKLFL
uniref:Putative secreted protein n=1 Tax=Ixodes ricinus TaxID=34613 RepID=A0A6B0UDP5_IXORI